LGIPLAAGSELISVGPLVRFCNSSAVDGQVDFRVEWGWMAQNSGRLMAEVEVQSRSEVLGPW